jgi:hypothetical protein
VKRNSNGNAIPEKASISRPGEDEQISGLNVTNTSGPEASLKCVLNRAGYSTGIRTVSGS